MYPAVDRIQVWDEYTNQTLWVKEELVMGDGGGGGGSGDVWVMEVVILVMGGVDTCDQVTLYGRGIV